MMRIILILFVIGVLSCSGNNICEETQFYCNKSDKCIPSTWRCDGDIDCEIGKNVGEDELDCINIDKCETSEFRCHSGPCIPIHWTCDKDPDCSDGSDEGSICDNKTCKANKFDCGDGICIPSQWKCDGAEDCPKGNDEQCKTPSCDHNEFACANGKCITTKWKCDGQNDCQDDSDEKDCRVRDSLTTHKMPNRTTSLYDYAIDGKQTSTLFNAATTTTTPPLPQRSDISCNADSIDTFVPISMLPSGAPLTWRDPTCSVTSNGTHMISSIGLSQCGTTVTITKDNVEFENELKAQSTNSTANTLIDFGEDAYVIPVKCIYPRTETPMMSYVPLQQHVRFYEKRYGHFDVDIIQYDSDKFSSAIQNIGTPRKVALNSEIYVEVKLNDQFNNGLGIHIDKCIATPTSSPSDSTLYTLLTDGCPASQHVHLYNSPANKVRFGVRAFQFTSQTGSMVYIHCQTSMCEAGTPYCTSNCVTAGRRKRDVAPDQKSHLVSAGPFVLVADEQGTPIRMSTIVASVSAFVAVVACVVAIVGWTRKTRTTSTQEQGLL